MDKLSPAGLACSKLCHMSKTPMVLEAVWNSRVTVSAGEARNERGASKHVFHWADLEAGQAIAPINWQ